MISAAKTYPPRLLVPVGSQDHMRGPEDAAVTLVEYGDFQCPYCGAAYPIVKELVDREPIRFVFRNFPIVTLHPRAETAAEAAEAAGAQGKYWQMHDWIYEHQQTIAPEDVRHEGIDVTYPLTSTVARSCCAGVTSPRGCPRPDRSAGHRCG